MVGRGEEIGKILMFMVGCVFFFVEHRCERIFVVVFCNVVILRVLFDWFYWWCHLCLLCRWHGSGHYIVEVRGMESVFWLDLRRISYVQMHFT